ncbi:MAG: hypothetical protein AAB414_02850 [Patescibacteria group bacterium]
MTLHIDTKDQKVIKVALKENGKAVKSLSAKNKYGSQVLLPLIIKLLKRKGVNLRHLEGVLKEVEVETGPGSFTGIRVGVSVANALGYSLGILVNGKKIETDLVY